MASVFSYRKYLSAFLDLYQSQGGSIQKFHAAVARLAACDRAEREDILLRRRDQIQC